jgi:hypothetical protein
MSGIDEQVCEIGQELFGEDNKRREVDALLAALDEAIKDGRQEAADALRDRLDNIDPAIPLCPAEWSGWSPYVTSGLLEKIAKVIRRFVYLRDNQEAILAAWVLHTYVFKLSRHTPYMFVTAPERASGKSTLMDVLKVMVHNPFRTDGITAAALVKRVSRIQPTLFIDELDAMLASSPELAAAAQGILNAGFHRNGVLTKCAGANNEDRDYVVFCPKAFAGIGDLLHPTTASRSIHIQMRRRAANEAIEVFDEEDSEQLAAPIVEMAKGWAKAVTPYFTTFRIKHVHGWDGRQMDTARPLLTIAMLAGTAWFNRVLSALRIAFKNSADASESLGTLLLADIREYFAEKGTDRVVTDELLRHLHQRDDRDYPGWGPRHEPMKPHHLGKELRKYGIASRTIRIGTATAKGYLRDDFNDAWSRLCPPIASTSHAESRPVTAPKDDERWVEI